MRARSLWLVVALAIMLAGCANDAAPAARPFEDPATRAPPSQLRPMMWTTLSAGAFTVGPMEGWGLDIAIPPGTQSILVNLSDLVGPTVGLRGVVAECSWEFGGVFVARGQSTGFGCPQPFDGPDRVALVQDAGRLEGLYEVVVYHAR